MYSRQELAYRRKKLFELDNGSLWDSFWVTALITIPFALVAAGLSGWEYRSFWASLEFLIVTAVGVGAIHMLERLYVLHSRKDLRLYRGFPFFNTLPAWILAVTVATGNSYFLNQMYGQHDLAGPMTIVGIVLFVLSIPFDLFVVEKYRLRKYFETKRA